MPRSFVFVWENLGPTHEDRLAALAARFPGRVRAVQFWPESELYPWAASGERSVPTHTLAPRDDALGGARLAWRLFRACARPRGADVYLCHYERWPVLLAAILLRGARARVFCMIDSKFDDRPRRLAREIGKALFLLPYHGALVGSPRTAAYVRFLGLHRRPVALGYDALSVARIVAQAPRPPAPDGVPHRERDFLAVARLVPKKNLALAIAAYAEWRRQTGGARKLRLCGSGPLEHELRALADRLGVADGVVFEGFVQTGRVSAALAGALCLLLPSVEEQFGLVVIEAMAMGVPALVSANAGAVDVLIENGVNGWLVDPRSPRALVAAMVRLHESEREWARMALAARADSRRGDGARFVEGVVALSAPA